MRAAADHAGRMDAIYRVQRHFYDLTRKYYLLGRDALIRDLAPPAKGTVMEVGCGTARNLIAAAKRWPDVRFYGVDISEAMLETARRNVEKAGLSERIVLVRGDATGFDPQALFGVAGFDRVFISYTLSMIPGWRNAIAAAAQAVAPGGSLAIVDFGQQEKLPRWWRAALFAWLATFDVTPCKGLPEVLERLARETGMTLAFRPRRRGYAWSATLARCVDSSSDSGFRRDDEALTPPRAIPAGSISRPAPASARASRRHHASAPA